MSMQITVDIEPLLERAGTLVDRGQLATAREILAVVCRGLARHGTPEASRKFAAVQAWRQSLQVLGACEAQLRGPEGVEELLGVWALEARSRGVVGVGEVSSPAS